MGSAHRGAAQQRAGGASAQRPLLQPLPQLLLPREALTDNLAATSASLAAGAAAAPCGRSPGLASSSASQSTTAADDLQQAGLGFMTWRKHKLSQERAACQLLIMQPGRPWRQRNQKLPPAVQQLSPQRGADPHRSRACTGSRQLHSLLQVLQRESMSVPVRSRSTCPGPTAAGTGQRALLAQPDATSPVSSDALARWDAEFQPLQIPLRYRSLT